MRETSEGGRGGKKEEEDEDDVSTYLPTYLPTYLILLGQAGPLVYFLRTEGREADDHLIDHTACMYVCMYV